METEAHLTAETEEAFGAFYEVTFPDVYTYLFRRCGGLHAVAEELTQETYLAAIAAIKAGDAALVRARWLMGVARHKLIDHFRRKEREERRLEAVAGELGRAPEITLDDVLPERALAALAGVPPMQRVALALRYIDGLSVPEIAEAIGRSVHATESLLARGRESLRRTFTEARDD